MNIIKRKKWKKGKTVWMKTLLMYVVTAKIRKVKKIHETWAVITQPQLNRSPCLNWNAKEKLLTIRKQYLMPFPFLNFISLAVSHVLPHLAQSTESHSHYCEVISRSHKCLANRRWKNGIRVWVSAYLGIIISLK